MITKNSTLLISAFFRDEDAAITVDWVVLTAAVMGMGVTAVLVITDQIGDNAIALDTSISAAVAAALS